MALAHSAAKKINLPSTDHSAIKHHNHTANQAISAIKQPSIFSVPYIIFLPKSEKGFRWILRLPTSKFNTQLPLTTIITKTTVAEMFKADLPSYHNH